MGRSPNKSIRRRSQELGIPRESERRVFKLDLNMYPYRIQKKIYTSGHRQTSNQSVNGFVTQSKTIQTFWIMSGSQSHRRVSYRGRYTQESAQHW